MRHSIARRALEALVLLSPASMLASCGASPTAVNSAGSSASLPVTDGPVAQCLAPTAADAPILFNGTPLVILCHGLYADPAATSDERSLLRHAFSDAQTDIATFFGASRTQTPIVISCKTDACEVQFSGPTRRSRASMKGEPRVFINGIGPLTRGTMTHEIVHVEVARHRNGKSLPTWFDEGVATFIGDNAPCPPGMKRAIDDLRRLDTNRAWEGFTNMTGKMKPAYCQARDEIKAWTGKHGKPAILGVIDAVAKGTSFDEAYGPVLTAIPKESFDHSLDGFFRLDENAGTNAVDESGKSHMASLMNGAIWTTGQHGSAVKVIGGSYVRADGFAELGVPDSPFSISLWAKPLASEHVLIHLAAPASGGGGWCMPLLGHDSAGHLAAQISYDGNPDAFLNAVGPALSLNAWSHVVVTWSSADGVRLFINGALAASAAPKNAAEHHRDAPASPIYLFLGSSNESKCWTSAVERGDWNGAVDEIRVFDYALSADEARADMAK